MTGYWLCNDIDSRRTKHHYPPDPPSPGKGLGGQVGLLAQACLTVYPVGPQTHPLVIPQFQNARVA